MEFARTIPWVLPECPGHARERGQQCAVRGDEFADFLAHPRVAESGQGLAGEIAQQPGQQFGITDVLPLGETGQLDGLAADLLWDALEAAGAAETAGTFERGMEQGEELERKIITGGQLLISSRRVSGPGQPGREVPLKLLQQFPVVKLIFTERGFEVGNSSDHATSKPQRGSGIQGQSGDRIVSIP